MQKTLVHYVYRPSKMVLAEVDGKRRMVRALGKRCGVMVAYTDASAPGKYLVGFSLCRDVDHFDRRLGTELALSKALVWSVRGKLPKFVKTHLRRVWFREEMNKFLTRCNKYFKGLGCVWTF